MTHNYDPGFVADPLPSASGEISERAPQDLSPFADDDLRIILSLDAGNELPVALRSEQPNLSL